MQAVKYIALIICLVSCQGGRARVTIISSDGSQRLGYCYDDPWDGYYLGTCLSKYCKNGFDLLTDKSETDFNPILKCKPEEIK